MLKLLYDTEKGCDFQCPKCDKIYHLYIKSAKVQRNPNCYNCLGRGKKMIIPIRRKVIYLKSRGSTPEQISIQLELSLEEVQSYIAGQALYNILYPKITRFCKKAPNSTTIREFNVNDLLNKIGNKPKCYLTNDSIDLMKSSTYQLDHIIPRSRGGNNSLENCQITIKHANLAKGYMSLEEFKKLCLKVSLHYKLINPDNLTGEK